jgi:hypothetical protein
MDLVDSDLFDKLHGGWLRKCVGTMLGRPCSGLGRPQIEFWLKVANAYPLDYYLPFVADGDVTPDWLRERSGLVRSDWREDRLGS